MKRSIFVTAVGLLSVAIAGAEAQNTYEVPYVEELPDGVIAWQQSGLLKDRRETRFGPYDKKAAEHLILDATADRGVAKEEGAPERETAFRMAYDSRGVGIFIEAAEPLIRELLDSTVDPTSPGRHESFEVFFTPALSGEAYYQLFINTFSGKTDFYDWGSPHQNYRSLREYARVETRSLKTGFGVSIFIPWEAIYENLPLKGGDWRFSIIRWMPFGKAGGVTWGGQVHETGQFGLLRFAKPTEEQRLNIERRLARYAWFNFLAKAKAATHFWSDEKVGDPDFYNSVLKSLIAGNTTLGESLGNPDDWTAESLKKIQPVQKDWLEFDYKVSDLRGKYLVQKRFENAR
ncbi:MAG: hypothetical protein IAE94_03710 [Chthoniobacterales bacterium]|nr:hypothetical protein [Chthoniobacterales bacterium]